MNEKVYIVTSGEYSDYSIEQVFSTKEKALEYLDTQDDAYRLEEYLLDEPIRRNERVFYIQFSLPKKEVLYVGSSTDIRMNGLIRFAPSKYGYPERLEIYISSDSRKRAIKVASERYGVIVALEKMKYPYLRIPLVEIFGFQETPYFDYGTGELVLMPMQKLITELPEYVRVRKIME